MRHLIGCRDRMWTTLQNVFAISFEDSFAMYVVVSFVGELWRFMRERKKFWLFPIFIVLGIFGGLLILAQGSAVAPLIYTLF